MKQPDSKKASSDWPGYKILFVIAILGIIGSFFGNLFGLYYLFGGFSIYIFYIILIIAAIMFFSRKKEEKVYKQSSAPPMTMKLQHIFYTIGVLFIFASVWYFAREFIADLPNTVKTALLIAGIIVAFTIAEILRGFNK